MKRIIEIPEYDYQYALDYANGKTSTLALNNTDRIINAIADSTSLNEGEDCISRAQVQTKIEMNASRYIIAKERGGMGQVEWSDQLIEVSDAVDIIRNLPPVTPQESFINKPCISSGVCEHDKQMVLDKINKMKSEIAGSLEFWDYSPNNNPLARDMLAILINFWGDVSEVEDGTN